MNRVEFSDLINKFHDQILDLNATKGHDYAGDEDALANFKEAGRQAGVPPEQVWAIYTYKHWSAIMTFCKEGHVTSEPIEGRITDLILYSYLLLGLIHDSEIEERVTGAEEIYTDQVTQKMEIPDFQLQQRHEG